MTAHRRSGGLRAERLLRALRAAAGKVRAGVRLLVRAGRNFLKDDGFDRCAVVSYYALLSFLPFLGLVGLIGRWLVGSRDRALDEILLGLEMMLPAAGTEAATRAREELARRGAAILVLTPLLLWTSSYAASAVEGSINHILRSQEHRRFLIAKLKSFALLAVSAVALLLIPAAQQLGVVLRLVSPRAFLPTQLAPAPGLLVEAGTFLAAFLTFAFTLLTIPAVRVPRRAALLVALGAAIVWQVARAALAWALGSVAGFGIVSGSFSFITAFSFWIYGTAMILLLAAETLALAAGRR